MLALVIDDSRTVRIIVGQILRELGMEVLEAGNGKEALEQLRQNPDVDLMLVDWNMPTMNGYDLLCAVRSQRAYDSIRILMVTSESQADHVTQAMNAGANEYLMKPFNKEVLVAKLNLLDVIQEQGVSKIRILVVDDAAVIRRAVTQELDNDPALEVVGTAANGRIALAKLPQVNPDVVILDIEMPEMDGLATLKELRKTYPRLPVIVFSALTERGAETTLDALALGATDYFAKPVSEGGLEASLAVIREQLIPEIKALCPNVGKSIAVSAPSSNARDLNRGVAKETATLASAPQSSRRVSAGPVHIVAVGSSTGGPNALADILGRLPKDFPVPILIVQHMPPMFTRLLAERLSAQAPICVHEANSGSVLEPGHAWIAPGDHHMIVVRNGHQARLLLHQDPPENSCRPAVDVLLRSVAKSFGPNSLTVILTGMGQDGLRGCETVREVGGQIIAQDEASSVVWGMPGAVARAGLADRVLPLALVADEIIRRVHEHKPKS